MKKRALISIFLTIGAILATYNVWHHESVLIFISIMVLSFLFAYKITDYIADFKTVKNNSRIDIVLLLIFFILLCIPASHIQKAQKTKRENRYLAPKTSLIKQKKLNLNFGTEFNNWFNDRFNLRSKMIALNTIINCTLNANYCGNKTVTFYKKGNLLYRNGYYFGLTKPQKNEQEILAAYASNLNTLQKFCDDNGIKLYFLVIPRQSDFFNYPLADKRNYEPDFAEEIVDYLKANTKTNIIYPKEALKIANKQTPVYFKTDHHWTKKGAYVGYNELMRQVKKDFPSVPILEESSLEKYYDNRVSEHWGKEFNNGQTFKQLGLPKSYAKKILDTPYLYYKNPYEEKLQIGGNFAPIPEIGKHDEQDNLFYCPDGLNKKVMIIGNSFAANLVEFLPYSFKYTARYYDNYRYMNFEVYEDVFKEYKPDILILNVTSLYIRALLNLYPNKYRWEEVQ
ncbi:MAG: hypothetical protein K6A44_05965 [bacterium]|nr:hypothetical protein [bacterium]